MPAAGAAAATASAVPAAPSAFAAPAAPVAASADLQEQVVQRVLQRVDLMLDRRLREVVGQLILEHTQSLAPRLREEIEGMVRQAVDQAFANETTPPPAGG
jgi:hypothetical protein